MNQATTNLIHLQDMQFCWSKQSSELLVIPELSIEQGKHTFIQGSSGSGKTTLLKRLI